MLQITELLRWMERRREQEGGVVEGGPVDGRDDGSWMTLIVVD